MYYAARPESAWKAAARLREAVTTAKPYGGMLRDGGQIVGESGSVVANTWRRIQGVPMADMQPIMGIHCPNVLFPYVRETIADAISRKGRNMAVAAGLA